MEVKEKLPEGVIVQVRKKGERSRSFTVYHATVEEVFSTFVDVIKDNKGKEIEAKK